MNGSEAMGRRPQLVDPRDQYSQPGQLSDSEIMDLMVGDDTPYAKALDKLMKLTIVDARNQALEADPSDKEAQATKMTVAHAMNKFYENLRQIVHVEKTKHHLEVKLKAAEAELEDQQKLEEVIFSNTTGL